MSTAFVVMGREFYSSWPVRVFRDKQDAWSFADNLNTRYAELRQPTSEDTAEAVKYGNATDSVIAIIAEQRAQRVLVEAGLDERAGGLDLDWTVVEVPEGSAD